MTTPILKTLFNPEGRVNRKKYISWLALFTIFQLSFLIIESLFSGEIVESFFAILYIVSLFLIFYASIILAVKRSHDINKSGFFIILMFIPIINIYPTIVLMCQKGTSGQNDYGEDPLL
ncbi:MAG: DUF805 domain-containing protein [Alphaproteobacteria bacterium]|nr:DUF805 domain-containing protein [Alphaproteobacteria bacterium]